ncbi:hypothetical protein LIER_03980 [Lithospermum erythrorhizon]|uniref:F-box domain-containing protein n=1 Tax=Lithospermum erythrorhizon TaxID=34254 RepID=A0AAV3NZS6_LITER
METRSSKKKRLALMITMFEHSANDNEDRISDLPDAVIHQILFLLPIKSIAQTSVLSRRWKYIWHSLPDLDFTSLPSGTIKSSNKKGVNSSNNDTSGAEFINQVLSLREKQFEIRTLRFCACLTFSRLNSLIRSAVKHNVQELDIEVATNDYFNFPRSVIICDTLRVLKLKSRYPGFRLPPPGIMGAGFRSLHALSLSRLILHDQPSLTNLFSYPSFPQLKKLNLDACYGLKHLNISCRALEDLILENCAKLEDLDVTCLKLEKLKVLSCFDAYSMSSSVKIVAPRLRNIFWSYNKITESSSLQNLTSLCEAYVGFFILHEELSEAKLGSVANFLAGISHSESLTLDSQCVEILSKNRHMGGIVIQPYNKLEFLELRTGFNKHNMPGLANLFRSSPIIHTLIIKIIDNHSAERRLWNRDLWKFSNTGDERYWESQSRALKSFLHHLKVVKMHGFSECENDISFVKFLLKHGKNLHQMFLITGISRTSRDSLHRENIKSQIMGFSRASSNATIIFQYEIL